MTAIPTILKVLTPEGDELDVSNHAGGQATAAPLKARPTAKTKTKKVKTPVPPTVSTPASLSEPEPESTPQLIVSFDADDEVLVEAPKVTTPLDLETFAPTPLVVSGLPTASVPIPLVVSQPSNVVTSNPTPLVVSEPTTAFDDIPPVVFAPEPALETGEEETSKGIYKWEYQTKLSAGELLLARKFSAPHAPPGWEQRWSQESDGLRRLMEIACDALQANPALGQDVKIPPGTFSKGTSLRVDEHLFHRMEAVKQVDETNYTLVKRLIQIGANARPDIRDSFLE